MNSPTQQGGDEAARERRENLEAAEAEAQHEAPTPIPQEPEPQAAPEPEPEPEPTRPDDERAARIEARAEAAAQRLRDAQGRFVSEADDDESAEVEDEPEPEAEAAEPADETPVPANLPPGTRLGEDGQWYVDLKVDGVERSIPASQYHAMVQKALTADQRLQQAAIERKQLEALRVQQGSQPPAQGAGVMSPPQGAAQEIPDDVWDKAVIDGDPAARQQFIEQVRAMVTPQVDPAALTAQTREVVDAAILTRTVESTEQALALDPEHGQMNAYVTTAHRDRADARSAELYAQGWTDPEANIRESVRQVREEIRAELAQTFGFQQAPVPPPAVSPASRTQAKAAHSAVNATRGAQSRTPYQPPAMTAEDMRLEAIADERRARGLI